MSEWPILWPVVERHFRDATFLGRLRDRALDSLRQTLSDLERSAERRLIAHIDGLVVAGPRALPRLLALRPGAAEAPARPCAGRERGGTGAALDELSDDVDAVGLRIRRGSSFHGMALNVDVDLEPFRRINPCGYAELEMTDLHRLGIELQLEETSEKLLPHFLKHLGLDEQ